MRSPDYSVLTQGFRKTAPDFKYIKLNIKDARNIIINDQIRKGKTHSEAISKYKVLIHKKDGEMLVDARDNSVIGFAYVNRETNELNPIYINPKYRGYGFSEILMTDAIKKYGCTWLGVYADNQLAIKLYKKMGFVIDNEKVDIFPDGKIIYMKLK